MVIVFDFFWVFMMLCYFSYFIFSDALQFHSNYDIWRYIDTIFYFPDNASPDNIQQFQKNSMLFSIVQLLLSICKCYFGLGTWRNFFQRVTLERYYLISLTFYIYKFTIATLISLVKFNLNVWIIHFGHSLVMLYFSRILQDHLDEKFYRRPQFAKADRRSQGRSMSHTNSKYNINDSQV